MNNLPIPHHWSPHQALAVLDFLEEIYQAIWEERLANRLHPSPLLQGRGPWNRLARREPYSLPCLCFLQAGARVGLPETAWLRLRLNFSRYAGWMEGQGIAQMPAHRILVSG